MNSSETPSDLLTMPAKCKFCQKPLSLKVDPLGCDSPMFDLNTLIKMAACNRCADYYTEVRSLDEAIASVAWKSKHTKKKDDMDKLRGTLVTLTKGYAELVCDHFHKITTWEPDFVQKILDQPDKSGKILKVFRQFVARPRI